MRALLRRAGVQLRQRIDRAAPRLHERAVAGAILQANRIKAVVQPPDVCCERRCALRRVVDGLPSVAADSRSGAVHRLRGLNGVGLATANLEVAVRDCAIDEQIGRLHGERLQKVHATQCCRGCRTRHLEVARAREDDAALHDVVGDEGVKRARSRRAEDDAAVR